MYSKAFTCCHYEHDPFHSISAASSSIEPAAPPCQSAQSGPSHLHAQRGQQQSMTNKQTHWTSAQNPIHFKPHNSVSLPETLRNRHTLFGRTRSSFSGRLCSVLPNAELLRVSIQSTHSAWGEISGQTLTHSLSHTHKRSLNRSIHF